MVDALRDNGIDAFGPDREAAQLEGSKIFSKEFMARHDIPTAGFAVFDDPDAATRYIEEANRPLVVKADGLAAGKGVIVASDAKEAIAGVDRIMRERLGDACRDYDVVVIDCAPALSLMNQNAMVYADSVVVPVACDYLSLVGVKQVLRTIRNVRELLQHDVQLLGVLPTFFDVRNRISREAILTMREHFEGRCYDPIRINTKLREAPSAKQTIFEYAPKSHGAEDYMRLVQRVTAVAATGQGAKKRAALSVAS